MFEINKINNIGETYEPFIFFVDTVSFFMNINDCFDTKSFSLNIDKTIYKSCQAINIPVSELIYTIKTAIYHNMIVYIVKDFNSLYTVSKVDGEDAYIYMLKSPQTSQYFRKVKLNKIFK